MSPTISLLCFLLCSPVSAFPVDSASPAASRLQKRQGNSTALLPYSLPDGSVLRAADIATKQAGFVYGPAVGTGPYYPAGVLGLVYDAADTTAETLELGAETVLGTADFTKATLDIAKYNGLQSLDDYVKLYDDEWVASSMPTGQAPGILTNYTQDLLFSMERLSFNPYAVKRLDPGRDTLAFNVDDNTALNITGQTLSALFQSGRLFYADHRNQSSLERTTDKYAAACDAYFYISSATGDFLPLAIRTNYGSNLIYTPEDEPNDWLLAKMLYNINDFFMNQLDHFARSHFTTEIAYMAAVRTLSDNHPVLAILSRLAFAAFSIRPLALLVLIRPGGTFDQLFGYGGEAAAQFSNDTYFNGYAGAFQANYFRTDLQNRGLINSSIGPALKNFPYYEDAAPIFDAIRDFTGSFVSSYYADATAISGDVELQAWLAEANGPAMAIDFPNKSTLRTPSDLADLLAEIARLVSVSHHTQNTNQLITSASTLPFHPTAFYKSIPDAKGVTNVAEYLCPLTSCLETIQTASSFSRPLLAGTNRSVIHMWDDPVMLNRTNAATQAANSHFMTVMTARSLVVKSRTFGPDGLSQGMPFVWQALDPNVAPFSLTI